MSSQSQHEPVQDIRIFGVVLLDFEGQRLVSKYYPNYNKSHILLHNNVNNNAKPLERNAQRELLTLSSEKQTQFETQLHSHTLVLQSDETDILLIDTYTVFFDVYSDVKIFLIIDNRENEVIAQLSLQCLTQCFQQLFDFKLNKTNLLEYIDLVLITIDECIDDGYILELDPDVLFERVSMKSQQQDPDNPLPEQVTGHNFHQHDTSLSTALGSVGSALFRAWRGQ